MHYKNQQAIDYIESWASQLDPKDPSVQSWGSDGLIQALKTYDFVFLGRDDQFMTSCVVFQKIANDICEILFLATVKSSYQKGQMARLLGDFIAHGPFERIWLECRADNAAAIHLYRKLGFEESGQRQNYYKDGTAAILFVFFKNRHK